MEVAPALNGLKDIYLRQQAALYNMNTSSSLTLHSNSNKDFYGLGLQSSKKHDNTSFPVDLQGASIVSECKFKYKNECHEKTLFDHVFMEHLPMSISVVSSTGNLKTPHICESGCKIARIKDTIHMHTVQCIHTFSN